MAVGFIQLWSGVNKLVVPLVVDMGQIADGWRIPTGVMETKNVVANVYKKLVIVRNVQVEEERD